MVATLLAAGSSFSEPAGARPHLGAAQPETALGECRCTDAQASQGWCAACGVGWVASLRIPSALLFDLLDPHGHEVDLSGVTCAACHAARESNGYCETHQIGYSQGRAYVTRLGYLLARGEPVRATEEYRRLRSALKLLGRCEYCALASFANGRCPRCDVHYRDGKRISVTTEEGLP